MIGMSIFATIAFIMLLSALGILIYEAIDTFRKCGMSKIDVFFAAVFIIFVISVALMIFGI